MCRCLDVKRPTYYKWTQRATGPQEARRNLILEEIKKVMEQFKNRYGIRRVYKELKNRYSRKVVGWSIANHMRASFVCEALQSALNRRPGTRPMVHSDRGSQYASEEFRKMLWKNKLLQSMSRKGDCWDNAPTESFFSTLKLELDVYLLKAAPELRQEVFEYIEVFYNRQRLHSTKGYRTPEGVEIEFWSLAAVS